MVAYLDGLLLGLRVHHPFHPSSGQTCLQDLEDLLLVHLVGMGTQGGSLVGVHLLQLLGVLLGILEVDLLALALVRSQAIDLVGKCLKLLQLLMELSQLRSSEPVLASE